MNDLIESLNDKIKYAELIVKRLEALSYKVTSEDEFMIRAQYNSHHTLSVLDGLENDTIHTFPVGGTVNIQA